MDSMTRYVANPVVSCGDEEGGSILFNPDTDDMVVINPSGRALWDYLEAPRSVDDLAAHLIDAYPDVEEGRAREDAQAFVESLMGDFVLERQAENEH